MQLTMTVVRVFSSRPDRYVFTMDVLPVPAVPTNMTGCPLRTSWCMRAERRVESTVGTTSDENCASPGPVPMGTAVYLSTRVDQCSNSSVSVLKKKS